MVAVQEDTKFTARGVTGAFGVILEESGKSGISALRQFLRDLHGGSQRIASLVKSNLMVAQGIGPALGVPPPLFTEVLLDLHSLFFGVVVHVAPAHIAGHIVHGEGGHCLDPGVSPGGGNGHAGQSADAYRPNPITVHIAPKGPATMMAAFFCAA